jgi:hypothetical protein
VLLHDERCRRLGPRHAGPTFLGLALSGQVFSIGCGSLSLATDTGPQGKALA